MWVVQALVDGRRLVLAGQRCERSALNAQFPQAQRLVLQIKCKQIRAADKHANVRKRGAQVRKATEANTSRQADLDQGQQRADDERDGGAAAAAAAGRLRCQHRRQLVAQALSACDPHA